MAGGTQGTGQAAYKVPDEMRNMAERSVTQARQALEGYMQATRRAAETMQQTSGKVQAGATDAAQKTLSAVEQTLRASLDYAERLVHAKDLQEVSRIQSEFARAQSEAMQAQMKDYGSFVQSAMDTARDIAQSTTELVKDTAQSVAGTVSQAANKATGAGTTDTGKGTRK